MRPRTGHNLTARTAPDFRGPAPSLRQEGRQCLSQTPLLTTQEPAVTRTRSRPLSVFFSSATPEWNTPRQVVDRIIAVLGSVDLDPCSNSRANPNIPARSHYTRQEDGLAQVWTGRVYMNPPYGREIGSWVRKLHDAYQSGSVCEAVALLPARTDTQWFRVLRPYPKCFVTGRLKFGEARNSAPFPSVVVYLGNRLSQFTAAFAALGDVYVPLPNERGRTDRCLPEFSDI